MIRPFDSLVGKDAALRALLDACRPADGAEEVPLDEAAGRVLARDLAAPADVPAFDRCAMDGYAVRAADAAPGARLRVAGRAMAGEPWTGTLPPGAAVEVATGAVLPAGADAVVMAERTERAGDVVVLAQPARPGEHVSARGGDLRRGEVVLRAGDALTPARVALVASLGLPTAPVRRRPRVAVLPSGTEVVPPGRPLPPGGVYDSNAYALAALARAHGADARRLPAAPDDPGAFAKALEDAARGADLVVTTGGSSVGERDLLRGAVDAAGRTLVHGVRIRPGRPVLVGLAHGAVVLGLPGYPASALVTAHVFLAPAVRALAGLAPPAGPVRRARLAEDAAKPRDFTLLLAVRVDAAGVARSTWKESGTLTSVTASDGVVEVPEGVERLPAGSEVEVAPWS